MSKLIISIPVQADSTLTGREVINAVRRALSGDVAFTPGESGEVKGLSYRVTAPKAPAAEVALTLVQQVRAFARENGIEVGKRGRIKPEVFEAFAAAQK